MVSIIIDLYFKEIGQKFLSHEVFRSQNVKINPHRQLHSTPLLTVNNVNLDYYVSYLV